MARSIGPAGRRTLGTRLATALGGLVLLGGASVPSASATARSPHAVSQASVVSALNAVRSAFHLPPGRLTHYDQGLVDFAVAHDADPMIGVAPQGVTYGDALFGEYSVMKSESLSGAEIVRDWVYEDGWRGPRTINPDCNGPKAPACNGHRKGVLSSSPISGTKLTYTVGIATTTREGYPTLKIALIILWSTKRLRA